MSPPDYSGVWKILYYWQTIIAGAAAIFGGWIAYQAGVKQAQATRDSVDKQIAATAAEVARIDAATAEAIIREIIECTKVIMEALRICECINSRILIMKRQNAHSIMMIPDPIVYREVANRIGRLPFEAQLVVAFYMRFAYTRQTIQVIVAGSHDEGAIVPCEEAETLAKHLIFTCQLGQAIISHAPSTGIDEQIFKITLAQIDEALESAKQSFPKLFRPQDSRE